jgi:MFS family permease
VPRGAWIAICLLLLINLFNYIDRWVLAATVPDIRKILVLDAESSGAADEPKMRLVMSKMGLLASAFMVFYMVTAPVFGFLAERMSRWLLIGIGVTLWSLASGASGLATTFTMLLVTRCFVGIGEGAYGPIAPTVISDLYPAAKRGRVLSWFYVAMPVGSALGYALGGQVAAIDPTGESWRWAFYVVVIPGLLLGAWSFLMRDPQRGAADRLAAPPRRARAKDYLVLLRTPSYVLNTLGMTAMTFAMGALAFWMPGYLKDNQVERLLGIEPITIFGAITALAGLLATPAGGIVGDALRKPFPGSYFLVSGAALCLCVPCALAFLVVPFPTAWVFVFLAEFFLFFGLGPSNTIVANVTHPSMRATGFAMYIFVIHALGDAISPFLVGWIADGFDGRLEPGFLFVAGFMLLGGVFWLCGARYLERDTAAAPHRMD